MRRWSQLHLLDVRCWSPPRSSSHARATAAQILALRRSTVVKCSTIAMVATLAACAGLVASAPFVAFAAASAQALVPGACLGPQPASTSQRQCHGSFVSCHQAGGCSRRTSRFAVSAPPPQIAPPDTVKPVVSEKAHWIECLVEHLSVGSNSSHSNHAEVWVFRRAHMGFFRRLLNIRSFQEGSDSVKCRQKRIDAETRCVDCVRLLHGGFYGSVGVSVPAYPMQTEALGCLGLSHFITAPCDPTDDQTCGSWDARPQQQVAFCSTISVRYDTDGVR